MNDIQSSNRKTQRLQAISDKRQGGKETAILINSVDLLEKAVRHAKSLGISIRSEFLDGIPGGLCLIGGKPHLFLDQSQTAADQLDVVMQALRDPHLRNSSTDSQH